MHLVVIVPVCAAGLIAVATGQPAVSRALLLVTAHYVFGAWLSFALHETGHAVALDSAPGVAALTLTRTTWRFSVAPHGVLRGRDVVEAALSGPGSCVVVGVVLWMLRPEAMLHGWYIAHAVFLLPVFADGQALFHGAAAGSRSLSSAAEGEMANTAADGRNDGRTESS